MLERLLETGARQRKSAWGGTASVVVHGAIIALAVAATAHAGPAPRSLHEDPRIIHLEPPPADDATGPVSGRGARTIDTRTAVLAIPSIDFTSTLAPALPDPAATFGTDTTLISEIGGAARDIGAPLGDSGVATDATVDVPVRALDDRAPAYPETLRAAGITGEVRLQFVVDTAGRAELSSVRVIESSHELFTRSVIASLRQARFTPGAVSGRRVRTLVERSFRFDIADGAR